MFILTVKRHPHLQSVYSGVGRAVRLQSDDLLGHGLEKLDGASSRLDYHVQLKPLVLTLKKRVNN